MMVVVMMTEKEWTEHKNGNEGLMTKSGYPSPRPNCPNQCDQIGRIFNFLVTNFLAKVAQIFHHLVTLSPTHPSTGRPRHERTLEANPLIKHLTNRFGQWRCQRECRRRCSAGRKFRQVCRSLQSGKSHGRCRMDLWNWTDYNTDFSFIVFTGLFFFIFVLSVQLTIK